MNVVGPVDHKTESRPVRLAVLLEQAPGAGGGYHQSMNAALAISRLAGSLCEPVFVSTSGRNAPALGAVGIHPEHLRFSFMDRLLLRLRRLAATPALARFARRLLGANPLDRYLARLGVELVYFTSPSPLALSLDQLPYIFTVWDLSHRDDVEFPEIRADREFEHRERLFRAATTKAVAVIVDSNAGAAGLAARYGVDSHRISVQPFSPAPGLVTDGPEPSVQSLESGTPHQFGEPYVLYPAQFWAHKNHAYIVRGLERLAADYDTHIRAIFPGGDKGNRKFVRDLAAELGVGDRIVFPGMVSDSELRQLYRDAFCVVMPTYFGPTNMPPLEAFLLGAPLLYSSHLAEQVGDAALLLDLDDPGDLARKLQSLIEDPDQRQMLIERGRDRYRSLVDTDQAQRELEGILQRFRSKRRAWGRELDPSKKEGPDQDQPLVGRKDS
jgi:glycosyltransferase involved in cell wall biosynthesis